MTVFKAELALLALVLLTACSNGPSDSVLKEQVAERFNRQTWGTAACRDHFSVEGVQVNDKQVEGAQAIASLTVSVKAKHAVNGMQGIAMCYGAKDWQEGEVKTFPVTMRLQRWESGWRIVSL